METEPQIETKTVKGLNGLTFKVPLYQRGYRWDKTNVKQLLSDLWQFEPEKKKSESTEKGSGDETASSKYSLQTLIVSKNAEGYYARTHNEVCLQGVRTYPCVQVRDPL